MEKSDRKPLPLRLLAFALSLLLVLSILPVNPLAIEGTVAYTLQVNKQGTGSGDVYYSIDGADRQKVQFNGSMGSIELRYYDEEEQQLPSFMDIFFEAGDYSRITGIDLPDGFNTVTHSQSMSHRLTDLDDLFNGVGGMSSCDVTFDSETSYTVKPGNADHAKLSVKAQDDGDFVQLTAAGRVLYESQLPAAVKVEPAAGYFTIQTVQIQGGGTVNPDVNGEFELNIDMFDEEGVAAINVAAEFAPTEDLNLEYTFSPSGGNGTAKILKNGATEPVALNKDTSLQPTELPATVTITPPKNKVIVEATLNGEPIITAEAPSLTYELKAEDFLNGDAILDPLKLNVKFGKSASAPTKLIIDGSTDYDVWVKNNGGEYQAAPQTGEVDLYFPATVKVQAKSEDHLVKSISLITDDGELGNENVAPAPYLEKTLDEATFGKYAEVRLQAATVQAYHVKLAEGSSQYARVTGFVKYNGSYPETGTEITAGAPLAVASDSDVKIVVTALEGHTLEGIAVGSAEPAGLTNDGNTATFVLEGVTEDQPIKITTGDLYKIQLGDYDEALGEVAVVKDGAVLEEIGSGSYVWLRPEQLNGAKLRFTPKAPEGKTVVVSDLTIGGEQELTNNKTIGAIASAKTLDAYSLTDNTLSVNVAFKELFTVTASVQSGSGTVAIFAGETSQGTSYTAFENEEITVKAKPGDNYSVLTILVNGTDRANDAGYSDDGTANLAIAVTEAMEIQANFALPITLNDISFNKEDVAEYDNSQMAVRVFKKLSNNDAIKIQYLQGTNIFGGENWTDCYYNNYYAGSGYEREWISTGWMPWDGYYTWKPITNAQGYLNKSQGITQSTKIELISYNLRQKDPKQSKDENGENELYRGTRVNGVPENGLYVIIDGTAPEIKNAENYNGKNYAYDLPVSLTITDPAEAVDGAEFEYGYSGIDDSTVEVKFYLGNTQVTAPDFVSGFSKAYTGINEKNCAINFTLNAKKLDGKTLTVIVSAKDKAGNTAEEKTFTVNFNTMLCLTFDDAAPSKVEDGYAYYLQYRYAEILVRDANFNPTGVSFAGSPAFEYVGDWSVKTGEENTHTRKIRFKDGSYQLTSLSYTSTQTDETVAPASTSIEVNEKFVVDTTAPTGKLMIGEEVSWETLLEELTFGAWQKSTVFVKAEAADEGSGVATMKYYAYYYTNEGDVSFKSESDLIALYEQDQQANPTNWKNYPTNGILVEANKRVVIYLRIEDNAGRVTYISTNGIVTDNQDPNVELTLPPTNYTHDGHKLYGREEDENGNPVETVDIKVKVTEPEVRSGVRSVVYRISTVLLTEEEEQSASGWTELYTNTPSTAAGHPAYSELVKEFSEETNPGEATISVSKAEFNTCQVYVYVKAVDNAGRAKISHEVFDVDFTNPEIEITFVEPENDTSPMIALITYTERTGHFNESAAMNENNLKFTGKNANDEEFNLMVNADYRFAGWTHTQGEGGLDAYTHVLKVELFTNARYTINAKYTDLAGNKTQVTSDECTWDNDPPKGTITLEGKGTWDKVLETLTFGLWSKDTVTVTGTAEDKTSGLLSVGYYKTSVTTAKTLDDLKALPAEEWTAIPREDWTAVNVPGTYKVKFDVTSLEANGNYVVYLRIEDNAENVDYLGTDGVIVDDMLQKSWIVLEPSAASGADVDGLPVYNAGDDVHVDVTVKDFETEDEPNSGIKLVTYTITAGDEKETGTLYSYEYTRDTGENPNGGHLVIKEYGETIKDEHDAIPSYEELRHDWSGTISVDKEKFNSCEVTVTVKVTDNAGNESENLVVLDIDNTAPEIAISRDEDGCEQHDGADDGYYCAYTALITYTERSHHFDPDEAARMTGEEPNLIITGSNAEGPITLVEGVNYELAGWTHNVDENDPDQDTHVLKIRFLTDANYEITANYTDRAGNKAAEAKSDSFTLDTEAPKGSVTAEGKGTWTKLLETLTFGLWSKDRVTVVGSAEDAVCDLKSVKYYKTADTAIKSDTELDDVTEWHELADGWGTKAENFDVTTVAPNEKFVIYLRLMDQAGNVRYLCTDGVVADNEMKQEWIVLTPSQASGKDAEGEPIYGIKDDVYVDISVKDYDNAEDPNSGIGVVKYQISAPNCETEEDLLYLYDYTRAEGENANGGSLIIVENGAQSPEETGAIPAYEDLPHEWNGTITVDKEKFNSCDVTVKVIVGDNAGNTAENEVVLDIDNTAPTIEVSYETERNPRAEAGYYTAVTATVTITERDHHFDKKKATEEGISIDGYDVNGNKLSLQPGTDYIISDWTTKNENAGDACQHTATIRFIRDALYILRITYTDRATNVSVPEKYEASFTKDATQPTGTLRIEKLTDETWINKIIDTLTFALFSRESVEVAHTASDETSPLISVDYFRTDRDTVYSESELAGLAESSWQSVGTGKFAAGSLSVGPDARVVVYLRVIDAAGNIRYVSTDGFILDATNPTNDTVAPRVTISQPVNGIYNTDVPVRVQVSDPVVNGSYSGLKEIRYEVKNMGAVTQSGTLYTYSGTATSQGGLTQKWEEDGKIVVDSAKNNSNDVEILVYAEDNAGNKGQDSVKIKIDVTDPTISVSYDNNDGDTSFANDKSDAFFNADRTATITITERNFDRNAVVITVTKNGVAQQVNPNWVENTAGGNGDGTTHVARLTFDEDGDYTFAISCTDLAGNKNKDVTFNGLAPERFTIDKTKPTITVSYDNNDVRNEKYFNADRTATVTIREHNFETSRIDVKITAANAGKTISQPNISAWEQKGDDQYSAKIYFTEDGDYTFDISYTDKAGNENEAVVFAQDTKAGSEFVVDTTPPEVALSGVENESANGDDGNIGFTLRATDTNFNVFEPVLTAYIYKDGKLTAQQIDLTGRIKDVPNGKELVITDLPEDGVYILTCTVVDKAGNAFTSFDRNGAEVAADGTENVQLAIFSVNRNGSTFYADDYSIALFDQYYAQSVDRDVVIYEINPDCLTEHAVSLNGTELKDNVDYVVEEETTNHWNRYTYTIHRNLFEEEGTYKLNVSSVDKAGNPADSDDMGGVRALNDSDGKILEVKFSVDRTAPLVTVSGLEDNGRYQTEAQTVTMIPVDDGGMLASLIITIMDDEGNELKELGMRLEGKELEDVLSENGSKIRLTLPENPNQYYVYITCTDTAGNETKMEFKEVTVSTSALRIFWANKPLRWGTIGGVGGAGLLFFFLLLAKKRKKKEEEVVPEKKS